MIYGKSGLDSNPIEIPESPATGSSELSTRLETDNVMGEKAMLWLWSSPTWMGSAAADGGGLEVSSLNSSCDTSSKQTSRNNPWLCTYVCV